MDRREDSTAPIIGFPDHPVLNEQRIGRESRRHGAAVAAWAFADLAFLLLIVFVLGASSSNRRLLAVQADDTSVQGPDIPPVRKEITIHVTLFDAPAGPRFSVEVLTAPPIAHSFPASSNLDQTRVIRSLRGQQGDLRTLLEDNTDYLLRYVLLCPATTDASVFVRAYATLQKEVGGDWFAGIQDAENTL